MSGPVSWSVFRVLLAPELRLLLVAERTCSVRCVTGVVCLWVCPAEQDSDDHPAIATAISGRAMRKPKTRLM
jgi:hypothetical protein